MRVFALERPDRALPLLRAETTIEAELQQVSAVIQDVERHSEWVAQCVESRLLRREGNVALHYTRIALSWLAADRDAVLRSELHVLAPDAELRASFSDITEPRVPPAPGVVRMPRLAGHYHLWALAGGGTRVEYLFDADPGGWLPTWLARSVARQLPLHTLQNLRARVAQTD